MSDISETLEFTWYFSLMLIFLGLLGLVVVVILGSSNKIIWWQSILYAILCFIFILIGFKLLKKVKYKASKSMKQQVIR